jgi:hypothetical protein
MSTVFPILIASKARPQGKTMHGLAQEGLPFTVYVEPQDVAAYRQAGWPRLRVLDANDQGLPYARRHILADAAPDWFWMLDDDISACFQTIRKRCVPCTFHTALLGAQRYFATASHVAQAALEYRQFAWSARQPYAMDSYCDVCVAIHGGRTRALTFRDACDLKLDRDFTLQVLAAGYSTCRVTAYSFSAPKNGSNAGGLAPLYAEDGREAAASRLMARLWPGICTVKRKADGRPDVAIDWGYFQRAKRQYLAHQSPAAGRRR